jgi:hypothetical protein
VRLTPALRLALLVFVLVAVGCASKNQGKLEGTRWRSDASTVKGKSYPEGYLKFEFEADGSLVYRAGKDTFAGHYTLGPGNMVTFNFDRPLGGATTHMQKVIVHGDRMAVIDGDGTEMRFQRQR